MAMRHPAAQACPSAAKARTERKERGSFLKKRTKKLSLP
jgi:hypothetical protein